jgi:hypothetical protein
VTYSCGIRETCPRYKISSLPERTEAVVAVPVTVAFLTGLDLLWLYTPGGRRVPEGPEPAD